MVGSVLKFDDFEKKRILEDFLMGGPPPPLLITAYDFLQEVTNIVRGDPMIFLHLGTFCFIIFLKSYIDTPHPEKS